MEEVEPVVMEKYEFENRDIKININFDLFGLAG